MSPYRTRICGNCDHVHDSAQCPSCGSSLYIPFTRTALFQPKVMQIILSENIQRKIPNYLSNRHAQIAGVSCR